MRSPHLRLALDEELIVDNFAGGGGASTGIEWALGRSPDIAINHSKVALSMHEANHPQTRHLCEDVFAVDPVAVTGGRRVGFAWFSPDCKHFSKAKGGKPRSKKIRGLAWVMVKWAASFAKAGLPMPRVMVLENVEEFQHWGPVLDCGTPCAKRRGDTFRNFVKRLQNLGYAVEWRELRACDYGAPTIRKRLFLIARCDGKPIVWPEPTHADPRRLGDSGTGGLGDKKAASFSKSPLPQVSKSLPPWRSAASCIDWSIPCHSIFLTKEEAKRFRVKRPLAEATMRRIHRGLHKFVINCAEPFIVPLTHQGSDRVESIREPMRTITGAHRGEKALCNVKAAPFISNVANSKTTGRGPNVWTPEEPLRTMTAAPSFSLISPTLIETGYGEREGQAPRAPGLEKPLGTIVSGGKHALIAAHLTEHANGTNPRSFDAHDPLRTQCAEVKGGHFALVQAFLSKGFSGEQHHASAPQAPLPTVTATDHNSLVTANLMVNTSGHSGGASNAPMPTIPTGGHHALVATHLSKFYGTTTGQSANEPIHTIPAGGFKFAQVCAFLQKYYGNEKDGTDIRDPLHTVTTKDRIGIVTVAQVDYFIADIGLRMLVPKELFAGQGFPPGYIHDRTADGTPLTAEAQVRMCGNSVPPPFAAAIVTANVPELAVWTKDTRHLAWGAKKQVA